MCVCQCVGVCVCVGWVIPGGCTPPRPATLPTWPRGSLRGVRSALCDEVMGVIPGDFSANVRTAEAPTVAGCAVKSSSNTSDSRG